MAGGGDTAGLAEVAAQLAQINERLGQVEGQVATLHHRTSTQLQRALRYNSRAKWSDHPLQPVPHPDTGVLPPADSFPATVAGECRLSRC